MIDSREYVEELDLAKKLKGTEYSSLIVSLYDCPAVACVPVFMLKFFCCPVAWVAR